MEDPTQKEIDAVLQKLKGMSWDKFETFTRDLLSELGFRDAIVLTRGSQQGKDIVAKWHSDFTLGREVRCRFQCKHKSKGGLVDKKDIGDSVADFYGQSEDAFLFIVSNASLTNDAFSLLDQGFEKGLRYICGSQLVRLISAAPISAKSYLGITSLELKALRHFFDAKNWFEAQLQSKSTRGLVFSLSRFWTEPYTWFFYNSPSDEIVRDWTVSGGEFRFSCHNASADVQDVAGIELVLLNRTELPEFGIVNTTPKGGHSVKRVNIPLSNTLGVFNIGPAIPKGTYLESGRSYNCLIDFQTVDPGIYTFKIRSTGRGGGANIRESEIFRIVSLPKELPATYIDLHMWWPRSRIVIDKALSLSTTERNSFLNDIPNPELSVDKNSETGKWELVASERCTKKPEGAGADAPVYFEYVPRRSLALDDVTSEILNTRLRLDRRPLLEQSFTEFERNERLWDELMDESEPRGPADRYSGSQDTINNHLERFDPILKAHERMPWQAKFNADYACDYWHKGFKGHAKFYIHLAMLSSSANPGICAISYIIDCACKGKRLPEEDYTADLGAIAIKGFKRITKSSFIQKMLFRNRLPDVPKNYWHAMHLGFSKTPYKDTWSNQKW